MTEMYTIGEMYMLTEIDRPHNITCGDLFFCVSCKGTRAEFLHMETNRRIPYHSHSFPFKKVEFSDKLQGKKICITGALDFPRDYYKKIIEVNGGVFANGISKSLDLLIASNEFLRDEKYGAPSTKIQKAREYGITVLSFNNFLNLIK